MDHHNHHHNSDAHEMASMPQMDGMQGHGDHDHSGHSHSSSGAMGHMMSVSIKFLFLNIFSLRKIVSILCSQMGIGYYVISKLDNPPLL